MCFESILCLMTGMPYQRHRNEKHLFWYILNSIDDSLWFYLTLASHRDTDSQFYNGEPNYTLKELQEKIS